MLTGVSGASELLFSLGASVAFVSISDVSWSHAVTRGALYSGAAHDSEGNLTRLYHMIILTTKYVDHAHAPKIPTFSGTADSPRFRHNSLLNKLIKRLLIRPPKCSPTPPLPVEFSGLNHTNNNAVRSSEHKVCEPPRGLL